MLNRVSAKPMAMLVSLRSAVRSSHVEEKRSFFCVLRFRLNGRMSVINFYRTLADGNTKHYFYALKNYLVLVVQHRRQNQVRLGCGGGIMQPKYTGPHARRRTVTQSGHATKNFAVRKTSRREEFPRHWNVCFT